MSVVLSGFDSDDHVGLQLHRMIAEVLSRHISLMEGELLQIFVFILDQIQKVGRHYSLVEIQRRNFDVAVF